MSLYKKTLCILISGKAGVGKTTAKNYLADFLSADHYFFFADSFAFGVKEVAKSLGWDGKKDSRGRSLLQKVGQLGREYNPDIWVKQLFDRYGATALMPADAILVDDWRFPNELEFAKKYDPDFVEVITIRIEAPEREMLRGTPEYNEVSEVSLPSAHDVDLIDNTLEYSTKNTYNYTVLNSGTMSDFAHKLKCVYDSLKKLRDIIE